eukprot:Platyproteum_vivax@DN2730_c0_g1_i2.p1
MRNCSPPLDRTALCVSGTLTVCVTVFGGGRNVAVSGAHAPISSFKAHNSDILTVDWNKYRSTVLITGSTDHTMKTWDLRKASQPVNVLAGHSLAVRKVKTHPHHPNLAISASYDTNVCVWDIDKGAMLYQFAHHTEFVVGLDVSVFEDGLVASSSWDRHLAVWNIQSAPPTIPSRPAQTMAVGRPIPPI